MKLAWTQNGVAEANGWTYMIQTERPLHEGTIHSLLLRPPGYGRFYASSDLPVGPSVPYVYVGSSRQETIRYVKRSAQAHADSVAVRLGALRPDV